MYSDNLSELEEQIKLDSLLLLAPEKTNRFIEIT